MSVFDCLTIFLHMVASERIIRRYVMLLRCHPAKKLLPVQLWKHWKHNWSPKRHVVQIWDIKYVTASGQAILGHCYFSCDSESLIMQFTQHNYFVDVRHWSYICIPKCEFECILRFCILHGNFYEMNICIYLRWNSLHTKTIYTILEYISRLYNYFIFFRWFFNDCITCMWMNCQHKINKNMLQYLSFLLLSCN